MIFNFRSFPLVLILLSKASQVKISIRGGIKPAHNFFGWRMQGVQGAENFASSMVRDLTEKSPDFWGFHMKESSPSRERWVSFRREKRSASSSLSLGLRLRVHIKFHLQKDPSHLPNSWINASGPEEMEKRRGNFALRATSPAHLSCQKWAFSPLPTLLLMLDLRSLLVSVLFRIWLQMRRQGPPWGGDESSWAWKRGVYLYLDWTTVLHNAAGSFRYLHTT